MSDEITSPPSLSVYPVSENQLQSNQAYVLFYQRKNSTVRKWDSASQSDQPYQSKHATFRRIGEAVLKCLPVSWDVTYSKTPANVFHCLSSSLKELELFCYNGIVGLSPDRRRKWRKQEKKRVGLGWKGFKKRMRTNNCESALTETCRLLLSWQTS